jgi:hypothetical protein
MSNQIITMKFKTVRNWILKIMSVKLFKSAKIIYFQDLPIDLQTRLNEMYFGYDGNYIKYCIGDVDRFQNNFGKNLEMTKNQNMIDEWLISNGLTEDDYILIHLGW